MINENDIVKSVKKINDEIEENILGTVLTVYENGNYYLIEFVDQDGNTIGNGMYTVNKNDIELVKVF